MKRVILVVLALAFLLVSCAPVAHYIPVGAGSASYTYTVQDGDTVQQIAERFGISIGELLAANPQIGKYWQISPGDVLVIPGQEGKPAPPSPPTPTPSPPIPAPQPQPGRLAPVLPNSVQRWRALLVKYGQANGIDPDLLGVLMLLESGGRPNASSYAGAAGLMQVMPFHFRAGENKFDPETNVRVSCRYINANCAAYKRQPYQLGLCYNGGPGVASGGVMPSMETRMYSNWMRGIYNQRQQGYNSQSLQSWLNVNGGSGMRLVTRAQQYLGLTVGAAGWGDSDQPAPPRPTPQPTLQPQPTGLRDWTSARELQEFVRSFDGSDPGGLEGYESLADLKAFLLFDKTDKHPYTVDKHDCEDFAWQLACAAEYRGKALALCIALVFDNTGGVVGHVLNVAMVGSYTYRIEAMTDAVYLWSTRKGVPLQGATAALGFVNQARAADRYAALLYRGPSYIEPGWSSDTALVVLRVGSDFYVVDPVTKKVELTKFDPASLVEAVQALDARRGTE